MVAVVQVITELQVQQLRAAQHNRWMRSQIEVVVEPMEKRAAQELLSFDLPFQLLQVHLDYSSDQMVELVLSKRR